MNGTKRKPERETKSKRKPDPILELKRLTIKQLKSTDRGGQTQWCGGCYG